MVNSWITFGLAISAAAVTVGAYYWGTKSDEVEEEKKSTDESGMNECEVEDEEVFASVEESVAEEVDEDLAKPSTDECGEENVWNIPLIGEDVTEDDMTRLSIEGYGTHKEVDVVVIPLSEATEDKEAPEEMTKLQTERSGRRKEDDEAIPSIKETVDKEVGQEVNIPSMEELHAFLKNKNIQEANHCFIPRLVIRDSIRPYVQPAHHAVDPDREYPETYLLVSNVPHWADSKSLEKVLNEVCDSPVESVRFCVKERGTYAGTAMVTFLDPSFIRKEIPPTRMGKTQLSMVWIIDDIPMIEQPRYIVITNLPNKTTEKELRELLSPECNPKTIDMRTDEKNGLNCSATVSFDSSDEALEAEQILDGFIFNGRYICVQKDTDDEVDMTDESGIREKDYDDKATIPLIEATVDKEVQVDVTIASSDKPGFQKDDAPSIEESNDGEEGLNAPLEHRKMEEGIPRFLSRLMIKESIGPHMPYYIMNRTRLSPKGYLLVSNLPYWADTRCLGVVLNEVCESHFETMQFCEKERGEFAGRAVVTFDESPFVRKEILPIWMGSSLISMKWMTEVDLINLSMSESLRKARRSLDPSSTGGLSTIDENSQTCVRRGREMTISR